MSQQAVRWVQAAATGSASAAFTRDALANDSLDARLSQLFWHGPESATLLARRVVVTNVPPTATSDSLQVFLVQAMLATKCASHDYAAWQRRHRDWITALARQAHRRTQHPYAAGLAIAAGAADVQPPPSFLPFSACGERHVGAGGHDGIARAACGIQHGSAAGADRLPGGGHVAGLDDNGSDSDRGGCRQDARCTDTGGVLRGRHSAPLHRTAGVGAAASRSRRAAAAVAGVCADARIVHRSEPRLRFRAMARSGCFDGAGSVAVRGGCGVGGTVQHAVAGDRPAVDSASRHPGTAERGEPHSVTREMKTGELGDVDGATVSAVPVESTSVTPSRPVLALQQLLAADVAGDQAEVTDIVEEMREEFAAYGTVVEVRVQPETHTAVSSHRSDATVYVQFATDDEARAAWAAMQHRQFDGRPVHAALVPLSELPPALASEMCVLQLVQLASRDALRDAQERQDILEDVREELALHAPVMRVWLADQEEEEGEQEAAQYVSVCAAFAQRADAQRAAAAVHGRYFDGRRIQTRLQ
eukprot:ctg_281.g176